MSWSSSSGWLKAICLFGTENGGGPVKKKTPCIIKPISINKFCFCFLIEKCKTYSFVLVFAPGIEVFCICFVLYLCIEMYFVFVFAPNIKVYFVFVFALGHEVCFVFVFALGHWSSWCIEVSFVFAFSLGHWSVLLDLFHRVLIPPHFLLQFGQISFCWLSRIKWIPHRHTILITNKVRGAPKTIVRFWTKRWEYKSLEGAPNQELVPHQTLARWYAPLL